MRTNQGTYRTVREYWLEESHIAGGMNDDHGIIQGIRIRISSGLIDYMLHRSAPYEAIRIPLSVLVMSD